jgi:hypothetical protein
MRMLRMRSYLTRPQLNSGVGLLHNQLPWEAVVYFTVTYDGVPIGATMLEGWGVCAGRLFVLPAYEAFGLSRPARRLGIAFIATHWSRVPAPTAARAWRVASDEMGTLETRLGLLDASGAAVPSPRIAIVELPRRSPMAGAHIVADLGEAGAARGAILPQKPIRGMDASRPAA